MPNKFGLEKTSMNNKMPQRTVTLIYNSKLDVKVPGKHTLQLTANLHSSAVNRVEESEEWSRPIPSR